MSNEVNKPYISVLSNNNKGRLIGLMDRVNAKIEEGYVPIGGITILPSPDLDVVMTQAMFNAELIGKTVSKVVASTTTAPIVPLKDHKDVVKGTLAEGTLGDTKNSDKPVVKTSASNKPAVKPNVNLNKGKGNGSNKSTKN